MLNGEGCQELGCFRELTASSDAIVLQDVPEDVWKLEEQIVRKWWKLHGLPEALRRLGAANATTISDTNNWELMSWIVAWLIKWLFQPEALGDGDGVAVRATVEGEPSGTKEATEVQTQVDALLEDAEDVMEAEKTEVWGSGVEFSVFEHKFCKKYFGPAKASHISWSGMGF
jgi:hypothetical protein